MRVFVTGGSGWIGSAVVPELLGAGHQVLGLARSDASAEALAVAGAEVHRGSLDDLDCLHAGAAATDGVIHLAFKHDIAFAGDYRGAAEADLRAIETFGTALRGSQRPLVIASGTAALPPGRVSTERDVPAPDHPLRARFAGEQQAVALAADGVRSTTVRLAPTVHGNGDSGFVATLIGIARATGVAGYLGDGSNRWPAVHRFDAARLFRLALERAQAGSVLHGVADQGVPVREITHVIADRLGIPMVAVAAADAGKHFGFLANVLAADVPASSALT
ncbi:MAG: SDR family oxidoreductase, partial [Jatrophihabitans sp.]